MRNKALVYCIILGLIVGNFSLNIEDFTSMFKSVPLKSMISLVKITGAVPVQDKTKKNQFELKLPLPAPGSLITRGRKKY